MTTTLVIFQSQPSQCSFFTASRNRWIDVADIHLNVAYIHLELEGGKNCSIMKLNKRELNLNPLQNNHCS